MTIGEKIRFMRLLKGLSQEDMAEKLEISLNAFGRIERNETDLNLSKTNANNNCTRNVFDRIVVNRRADIKL